jgi:LacI family transcriptional regulator
MGGRVREFVFGVVMDYFRPGIVEGAGAYARAYGLRMDGRWSVRGDWMPNQPGWDGVLVHFLDMEDAFARVRALGKPMVKLDPDEQGWVVAADYRECGRMAFKELSEAGIERFCYQPDGASNIVRRSAEGFREVAIRAGAQLYGLPWLRTGRDIHEVALEISDAIRSIPKPCGLFLAHAGFTFTVVEYLNAAGIKVPQDVAIVVIDKDVQRTTEWTRVPLTGVVLDDWQQGHEAARMLHGLLEGKQPQPATVSIKPIGVRRRDSTGLCTNHDPVVAKALHLIHGPHGTTFTVDDIVSQVAASRRTLEIRFRKATGKSLHETLTERRIRDAKRALRNNSHTVSEIADACGYSSVHYFSAAFRRVTGIAPSDWRRQNSTAAGSDPPIAGD